MSSGPDEQQDSSSAPQAGAGDESTPDLGASTDVSVDPDEVQREQPEDDTPTSSAARFEDGDAKGGTGGLDAGGAG
jgi:hypothetical protein